MSGWGGKGQRGEIIMSMFNKNYNLIKNNVIYT
jgi:hypothetical protein